MLEATVDRPPDRLSGRFSGRNPDRTHGRSPPPHLARRAGFAARLPAPALLAVSAVFHYLGPAFAVLLFARLDLLGVAWLRIASAALVFAVWRRPWRGLRRMPAGQRWTLLALGLVLAAMNSVFYLAIARLPLSTVGAIEFLGVIVLAAIGIRGWRNTLALALAAGGVFTLTDVRLAAEPLGIALAFANCALFMLYVTLGHRVATAGTRDGSPRERSRSRVLAEVSTPPAPPASGIDRLGIAMLIAAVAALPLGIGAAMPAFTHPGWLLAGVAVGICSSVIPYVTDQLAMARLRRAAFALMLSILPASATIVGLLVLAQLPTARDVLGVALVTIAIAVHQHPARGPD